MHGLLHPSYDERNRKIGCNHVHKVIVRTPIVKEELPMACKNSREICKVSRGYRYAVSTVKESSTIVYQYVPRFVLNFAFLFESLPHQLQYITACGSPRATCTMPPHPEFIRDPSSNTLMYMATPATKQD